MAGLIWGVTLLCFALGAYCSHRMHGSVEFSFHWGLASWLLSILPFWQIIAYRTDNIVRDGLWYDILLMGVYCLVLTLLEKASGRVFNGFHVVGICVAMFGMILFHLGED